jgi:putative phage-type endonuclease
MNSQQRQTWLKERSKGIGGTDISAILGLNPWKTAYDVYLDKIGEAKPIEENMAMKMGTLLEPIVAGLYEYVTQRKLKECELIIHPKHDFIRGTPDRLIEGEDLGLEIKTLKSFDKFSSKSSAIGWGEEYTDQIPQHYFLQVVWYMLLTERAAFDVAALAGGQEFRIYRVNRDIELEKMLIEKADEFWNKNVLEKIPPEISMNDDPANYYSNSFAGAAVAMPEDIEVYSELVKVKGDIKALEEREDKLKQTLQLSMKEKDTLIDSSGVVLATWKNSETKRLDQKLLKASGIDLSSYYTTSSSRRFLIK